MTPLNQSIQGDCIEVLGRLESGSVDLVITDPPFMISHEARIKRGRNPQKYKGKDISFNFGNWDLFESEEAYYRWTETWFKEVARVLKPSGHIVCFFDKWKIGELVKIGKKLSIEGRQPLFWIKSNPVPCARKVNFMSAIEMAYWGTKWAGLNKSKATFNYQLGQHTDYLKCPITPTLRTRKRHPCEKHSQWIEWVMNYLSKEGDVVLDCFAGTGVVGEVARKLRRNYILIEKEKEYSDIINQRLSQQVLIEAPRPENRAFDIVNKYVGEST